VAAGGGLERADAGAVVGGSRLQRAQLRRVAAHGGVERVEPRALAAHGAQGGVDRRGGVVDGRLQLGVARRERGQVRDDDGPTRGAEGVQPRADAGNVGLECGAEAVEPPLQAALRRSHVVERAADVGGQRAGGSAGA
jgi:hypothetical protein